MSSKDLDYGELDKWTRKMIQRLEVEYPKEARKFLKTEIGGCKDEAISRTHKVTGNLIEGWKTQVKSKKGHYYGVLKNGAPHAHLIENGHFTKDGGWWEGHHMLEKTITNRQPIIDANMDKLFDDIFDL